MKKLLIVLVVLFSVSVAKADEGMWLLSLLKQNADKMQELGLRLSVDDIYSTDKPAIKDAIVGLGNAGQPFRHFCSSELVSDKGLLITNHHCAFDMIQSHSSVEHDYLKDGFWAYKMEDELANPGITASILERMEDVTERFNAKLNDNMNAMDRQIVIDEVTKAIVKEATEGTHFSAQVMPMFDGNQFFLYVYTIYKDVRLVGAPPQSLGKFGGDTDNWMWPRQTCDFSMLRVYTGPDGNPAEFSEDNIPLKPKHHLPISLKGVQDNDFAMVMGFPGTTDRFATSFELENIMDVTNYIRHKVRTVKLDVMKAGMDKNQKTRIQYASKYASTANYWKYSSEQNKALKQLNTMGHKQEIEAAFSEWVNADPARKAQYGDVISMVQDAYKEMKSFSTVSMYLSEALVGPETPRFAYRTSRLIENLLDESVPAQEKEETRVALREMAGEFYKDFNAEVEQNLYAALYKMYSDNVVNKEYHPEIIDIANKKYKGDFAKFAADLRKTSLFMNEASFNAFVQKPDKKKLQKDLVYIAGTSYFAIGMRLNAEQQDLKARAAKGDRLFVRGLMEMGQDKAWAPNANSTIRLTYGNVKSYSPRDGVFYDYFTTLAGVIEKEGPEGGEFEVPARLKELYATQNYGQYGTDYLVTCFITNNDITGGNSGSPVINANGELIGSAFDGNSEAMSGDIDFEENLQRCICVDIRYVLFVVDVYAGAKNLIEEMTIIK